jgi:hypothetical protein
MRKIALVFALATVTALLAQASSSYRITQTYALGGDGRWDYIVPDPPNHRLFIARQNRVMVVNEDSGTLLGEVSGIQGAHGTALGPLADLTARAGVANLVRPRLARFSKALLGVFRLPAGAPTRQVRRPRRTRLLPFDVHRFR